MTIYLLIVWCLMAWLIAPAIGAALKNRNRYDD
jgi:F0F1-type ATP synthase membrane subunit b/b'